MSGRGYSNVVVPTLTFASGTSDVSNRHQGTNVIHHSSTLMHNAASRNRGVIDFGALFLVLFWRSKKERNKYLRLRTIKIISSFLRSNLYVVTFTQNSIW